MTRPYKGKLSKPIPPVPQNIYLAAALVEYVATSKGLDPKAFAGVRERDAAHERQRMEMVARMELLCLHYGVEPHDSTGLAWALAVAHVPGMQIAKDRAGRKTKWTPHICARLRLELEAIQRERHGNLSLTEAARLAAKRGTWSHMAKGQGAGKDALTPRSTSGPCAC